MFLTRLVAPLGGIDTFYGPKTIGRAKHEEKCATVTRDAAKAPGSV